MQERRAKTGGLRPTVCLCFSEFVPHLNTKAEAAGAFHLFKGMTLMQKVERRKKTK